MKQHGRSLRHDDKWARHSASGIRFKPEFTGIQQQADGGYYTCSIAHGVHPEPFPESLFEFHILLATNPISIVLVDSSSL